MNESVTKVFVEQPLASPGSAKYDHLVVGQINNTETLVWRFTHGLDSDLTI